MMHPNRLRMILEADKPPPVRARFGARDREHKPGMAIATNPLGDKGGFPKGGKREPGTRKLIR